MNEYEYVHTASFPPHKLKHRVRVFTQSLDHEAVQCTAVVGLKQPTKAKKHIGGAVDLYAPEEKYIDLPLSAVKTQCLRKPFFL